MPAATVVLYIICSTCLYLGSNPIPIPKYSLPTLMDTKKAVSCPWGLWYSQIILETINVDDGVPHIIGFRGCFLNVHGAKLSWVEFIEKAHFSLGYYYNTPIKARTRNTVLEHYKTTTTHLPKKQLHQTTKFNKPAAPAIQNKMKSTTTDVLNQSFQTKPNKSNGQNKKPPSSAMQLSLLKLDEVGPVDNRPSTK